jgi:hypothetical protein
MTRRGERSMVNAASDLKSLGDGQKKERRTDTAFSAPPRAYKPAPAAAHFGRGKCCVCRAFNGRSPGWRFERDSSLTPTCRSMLLQCGHAALIFPYVSNTLYIGLHSVPSRRGRPEAPVYSAKAGMQVPLQRLSGRDLWQMTRAEISALHGPKSEEALPGKA